MIGNHTIFLISAILALSAPAAAADPAIGEWHGIAASLNGAVTLVVRIQGTPGHYTGALESVDQAPGEQIPLGGIEVSADKLAFEVPSIHASYEGRWDRTQQLWSGAFRQGGLSVALLLRRGPPVTHPKVAGLDGTWRASLHRDAATLPLILHDRTSRAGTRAALDSPDLGAFGLVVESLERSGDALRFRVPAADVSFAGTLAAGGERFSGRWSRTGQPEAEVVFTRDTAAPGPAKRTQWPITPHGYRAEDVAFANSSARGVTLAGTLTIPEGPGRFPAAVLITGSGLQDRDETIAGHHPFAVLADHLSRHGIAVLRVDDRGMGRSTGDPMRATSADFATDTEAAVRYLLGRREIDPAAVGLIGHSEGGLIGPLAALAEPRVAFLVMLAGPGTSTMQLMLSQARRLGPSMGRSAEAIERDATVRSAILRAVHDAPDSDHAIARVRALLTPEALRALGITEAQRDAVAQAFSGPWMHYFLRYDASAVLPRLRIPVLALGGSLDLQVPAAENLAAIRAALARNPDATVRELSGLNHLFQTARTGAVSEYEQLPETFAPIALDAISDWIRARFPEPRPAKP